MTLSNKVIVITGASKGLGKEIAFHAGRKGADLILVARTKTLLEQIQKEIENLSGKTPMIIICDITSEKEVFEMEKIIKEKYQYVDVLINNAGIGISKTFEKLSLDEMTEQFETNIFGTFYCIRFLLPLIKNSKNGYILNVGSLLSKMSFAETSVYAATKFALSGFSEGLRCELKKLNIKVGLFLPGIMNTSFNEKGDAAFRKIPKFIIIDTKKAARVIEKMIIKKKNTLYMNRGILFLMKIKRIFSR